MHSYKTPLGLVVINFTHLLEKINKDYNEQLEIWGILDATLKDNERTCLYLYFYVKHLNSTIKAHNNTKNIVFYVTQEPAKQYLDIISKYFPFIIHYGNVEFNWIVSNSGESREILESVKSTRYNFDYSKYTNRKAEKFYKKYKLAKTT